LPVQLASCGATSPGGVEVDDHCAAWQPFQRLDGQQARGYLAFMLGRRNDHVGSMERDDSSEDLLLAEQTGHVPRSTIDGVVRRSEQLLHLPAVPLPGGCDSDAVPTDAG